MDESISQGFFFQTVNISKRFATADELNAFWSLLTISCRGDRTTATATVDLDPRSRETIDYENWYLQFPCLTFSNESKSTKSSSRVVGRWQLDSNTTRSLCCLLVKETYYKKSAITTHYGYLVVNSRVIFFLFLFCFCKCLLLEVMNFCMLMTNINFFCLTLQKPGAPIPPKSNDSLKNHI